LHSAIQNKITQAEVTEKGGKKDMKKLGTVFMVATFALAGIGMSYAGFFDQVTVHGSVSTAYTGWEITGYSGTYVWKDTAQTNEIYVYQGDLPYPTGTNYDTANAYGWAIARGPITGETDDVYVEFHNIFPLDGTHSMGFTRWEADFYLHYTGSIPIKLFLEGTFTPPTPFTGNEIGWAAWETTQDIDGNGETNNELTLPVQLHNCQTIRIVIWIDVPQMTELVANKAWQGLGWELSGQDPVLNPLTFSMTFKLLQWNEA
jgi:hypothetical protein